MSRMKRSDPTGLGLSLLAAACFSAAGPFARSLMDAGWSAGAAAATRVGIAALLLAIPAVRALRGKWHLLRRDAGTIAVYGALTIAGCQVCYLHAVQHLSVGVALLLEYFGIVLIVGWMWLRHGRRPG